MLRHRFDTEPALTAVAAASLLSVAGVATAQTVTIRGDDARQSRNIEFYGADADIENPVSSSEDGSTLRSRSFDDLLAERRAGVRARLWFDGERRELFGRALPLARFDGSRGGVIVYGGADEIALYSAIRRRHDASFIYNPRPAFRNGVVKITGGDDHAAGGARFFVDSPTELGAGPDELEQIIWARTRAPLPPIALSPWQDVTEENIDELLRLRPYLATVNRDELLEDLRIARRQWLRENGYLSPRRFGGDADAADDRSPRMRDTQRILDARDDARPTKLGEDSFIRVTERDAAQEDAEDRRDNESAAEPASDQQDEPRRLKPDSFIRVNERRSDTGEASERV